ncbi:hypothetical protein TU94_20610 [Streptomyces cyaneogriseus subsp. noncyanogenus]|uniref:Uncharacterized protein n=1 Tax=Streptomyces cyaneogriseus subsp. noncyanogenus TaxID=477245 RepID=A0A0C5G4M0_9ACTN|nr:hypothetical protein TU94_20610 [Streptomyces cyaneogriseus subsp. noncyanogenus]
MTHPSKRDRSSFSLTERQTLLIPWPQVEYAYSGVASDGRRTMEGMLWSDPENEPPEELRETQARVRRMGVLLALAMVLAMIVIGVR